MSVYLPIAEISMNLLLLLAMGLAVGALAGMFGIGGGFIMTPLLIFLGIPPAIAVSTGAAQVVASSVSSAIGHWQRDNVDVKMGLLLLAGGVLGALLGVSVQHWLKAAGQLDLVISLTYVIVLGVVGGLMMIESIRSLMRERPVQGPVVASPGSSVAIAQRRANRHNWLQGLPFKQRFPRSKIYVSAIPPAAIGVLVGWLTAIMGVGGGFLIVPALIYLIAVPTRVAIGTSVFQIVFLTAITTVLQAVSNKSVDIMLAIPLMIGGVVGAQYGVEFGSRINVVKLRALLAAMVVAVALRMAYDLAIKPSELYSLELVR